jgi:cyclase
MTNALKDRYGTVILTIAGVALGMAPRVAAAQDPQQVVELTPVATGVYAALQPPAQRFDDGNAVIVLLDEGVLVVDTHNSPLRARAVITAIRQLTPLPIRWVVNTHWHGDHVQGSQAYRDAFPDVEFIAHVNTARDIDLRARAALEEDREAVPAWLERAREALETGVANGQALTPEQIPILRGQLQRREKYWVDIRAVTDLVIPTRTFTDTLTIASGRTVRLMHFAGHTEGDIVAWLPASRVLVTGDLLDDLPYTGHGSPRALVETLHAFEAMNFVAIIPGHGSIRRGYQHLQNVIALFDSIVRQAAAARAAGLDADAAVEHADVSSFRDRFVTDDASARYWDFFIGEAVRRAWNETPTEKRPPP